MKKNKDLIILIPAFNEEKNIKDVILKFKSYGDTLVIDDSSTDKTRSIVKKYSKYLIKNKKNIGYDLSLRKGIDFVCKNLKKKKYIITCDGDNQHDPKYIKNMLFFIKKKEFNLVIGSRNKFNRLSENIVSFISKYTLQIYDPYSGMKAYKISKIKKKLPIIKKLGDTIGLFGLIIFKNNEIKDLKIKVNNKNKESSYGENIFVTINMLLKFLKIYLKIFFIKI